MSNTVQQILGEEGFTIFGPMKDLGFVKWHPLADELKLKNIATVSAADIRACMEIPKLSGSDDDQAVSHLPVVVDTEKLAGKMPRSIPGRIAPQGVSKGFPYEQMQVIPLRHALKRLSVPGFDKSTLDFFFGASALNILASRGECLKKTQDAKYLAMKVPGTNIIMLNYLYFIDVDHSSYGHMFERFVLGQMMTGKHDIRPIKRVQLMHIGEHKVIVSDGVKGVDTNGNPVETRIRLGKGGSKFSQTLVQKKMFQMIAAGSIMTVRGQGTKIDLPGRAKKVTLQEIVPVGLAQMVRTVVEEPHSLPISEIEQGILTGLKALQKYDEMGKFEGNKVFQVGFDGAGKLELTEYDVADRHRMLPSNDVLADLISS